jgi:DNA-directed RNA polymerase subunit M/transcription elongation factor TFIIS
MATPMSLLDHMCPKCDYYMPLMEGTNEETGTKDLIRSCRNCGHTKDEQKGLVMETVVQEKASDAYRVYLNEFTKQDPRLPHIKTLKCPNEVCPSRSAKAESDVIYIKYDTANMKYLYICTNCDTQWRSRS